MSAQNTKSEEEKKPSWMPGDKDGAFSLMAQAKAALLSGEPIENPNIPPTIQVSIPIHVANYLIGAIDLIRDGCTANSALGLTRGEGRARKDAQQALIAIEMDELMEGGMSQAKAIEEIAKKYHLSSSGIKSAYPKGVEASDFFSFVKEKYGEDVAADLLESYCVKMKNSR